MSNESPDDSPNQKIIFVTEAPAPLDPIQTERRLTRIEWQLRALALLVMVPKLAGHDPSEVVTGAIQLLQNHI